MRWGFLIWELIFYLLWTFCPNLGSFCIVSSSLRFGQTSPLAFFRWLTVTSDRNAEICNRIPSNYCLPLLLSIAPRFWPSKPLAGLGRNWNRYLLTMLTWNCRDSTPPSAAPRAPKKKQRKNYQDEDKKSAINKKLILRLIFFIFNFSPFWSHNVHTYICYLLSLRWAVWHSYRMGYWNQWQTRGRKTPTFSGLPTGGRAATLIPCNEEVPVV